MDSFSLFPPLPSPVINLVPREINPQPTTPLLNPFKLIPAPPHHAMTDRKESGPAVMETNEVSEEDTAILNMEQAVEMAVASDEPPFNIDSLSSAEISTLLELPNPTPPPLIPVIIPPPPPSAKPPATTSGKKTIPSLMSIKPTYASAATKAKERVEDILHVYSSQTKKNQISADVWERIMEELISIHYNSVLSKAIDPKAIRVAHAGYDEKHACGFIACRDEVSAGWHKKAVSTIRLGGSVFRAWAKGDIPPVRLTRIYLPLRFHNLEAEDIINLLKAYNSELKDGELTFKRMENLLQGGRALFLEMDQDSYTHVRNKHYKLEFIMGDLDCHGVNIINPTTSSKGKDAKPTSSDTKSSTDLTSSPATSQQPASDTRSGITAILPANAISELAKISHATSSARDPRLAKKESINVEPATAEAESDSDGYSTTSSRGSAKYRPPERSTVSSNSELRKDDKEDRSRKDRHVKGEKRGREPSKKNAKDKISPGNPPKGKKGKK